MQTRIDKFIEFKKKMEREKKLQRTGLKRRDPSWDFSDADTKILTHGFHSYPAMMIPQVARRAINEWGKDARFILDPFMGSGTVLVEAKLQGKNSYGFDINPLAVLIAKVKTTPIDPVILKKEFSRLVNKIGNDMKLFFERKLKIDIPKYQNIDYWFKPEVSMQLQIIKQHIWDIEDNIIKDFFKVAFSETVRQVSNTRSSEYKLYRMSQDKLLRWKPNVFRVFIENVNNNIIRMREFYEKVKDIKAIAVPIQHNILDDIQIEKVGLILTSPPYGDSKTTVAYGQFSRLSLQWMDYDYEYIKKIDKLALGGKPPSSLRHNIPSDTLDVIINKIAEKDEKRAREVLGYFLDFYKASKKINEHLDENGFLVFVVANRTVKGIRIPTDEIYVEIFRSLDYSHLVTYIRAIPNKRMPYKVSPTNIKGETVETMSYENIIVLKK